MPAKLSFEPTPKDLWESIPDGGIAVLIGANNSGKSQAMKRLRRLQGETVYMLSTARFYSVNQLAGGGADPAKERQDLFQQFSTQDNSDQNSEANGLQLQNILTRLDDAERDRLFTLCTEVLGTEFQMTPVKPGNVFSAWVVTVGGEPLASTSSGTRLILTLFATLLDPRFSAMLIDEPELGLSPRAQLSIARYLLDPALRVKWFPHLRRIVVATHSHLFIDRVTWANNRVICRDGSKVRIKPVTSVAELHNLQFNMLGNDLETMFLPSAIVIVEGKTDFKLVKEAVRLRYPDKRITVINGESEGQMPMQIKILTDVLGAIDKSPYRPRLFALLDAVVSAGKVGRGTGTIEKIKRLGLDEANIVKLTGNGIEFYYPPEILSEIFHCTDPLSKLTINGDRVNCGDPALDYTKDELCNKVVESLKADSKLGQELEQFIGLVYRSTT